MDNSRNSSGHKDQGSCYRQGGKFIQWLDEATHCSPFIEGAKTFDEVVAEFKSKGVQYRITRIEDGRRLFINQKEQA